MEKEKEKEKNTHAIVKHQESIYVLYVFANDVFGLWQVDALNLILVVKGLDVRFMGDVLEPVLVQIEMVLLAAHIDNLLILIVLKDKIGAGNVWLKVEEDLVGFFGFI